MDRRARLAALVAAIEVGNGAEVESFAAELVEMLSPRAGRHQHTVTSAAVRLFAILPVQARSAAVCVARDALVAAAETINSDEPLARRSLAMLAGATAAPSLCRALPAMLLAKDPTVAAAAEQAISDLGSLAATSSPDRAQCEHVLVDAVAGYDRHRRRTVLLSGLRLLGTPAGLAGAADARSEWLADSSHPASLAIRSLLRREQGPEVARAALVWLRVPAQAPACRDRLIAAASPAEHEAVLRHAHLLAHPLRARSLQSKRSSRSSSDDPAWTIDPESLAQLPTAARRHVPRWIAALPAELVGAKAPTGTLAADPEPVVRLAAISSAAAEQSAPDLLDLVYDNDDAIARSATIRVARARAARRTPQTSAQMSATITRLQRSPHANVRAIAYAAHEDPHGPGARASLRLAMRRDRSHTLAELRDMLLMGEVPSRIAWIGTCRVIGAAVDLERDICDLAEEFMASPSSDDTTLNAGLMLAATAVAALGDGVGERSKQVLLQATVASDPRVAANAIEAFARRARRTPAAITDVSRLIEFKDAVEHRVRSTAALAMLRTCLGETERVGAEVLSAMLADGRPLHRLAGLWLADRAVSSAAVQPQVLVEPVTRLRDDADGVVQERAIRCRRRLGALAGAREVSA